MAGNNTSTCALSHMALFISSSTNLASAVICLLAAVLVGATKLYKKTVYRLALYQDLSAMLLGMAGGFQMLIGWKHFEQPQVFNPLCAAIACMNLYSQWLKILFTAWVTFHLFCFAVFQKNFKKLEMLYVVTSLIVPAVIAAIPFTTKTYGLSG